MAEQSLSFRRILWTTVAGLLSALVVLIILLQVILRYEEFTDRSTSMRANFVAQQQQMVKREVDRILQRIEFKRGQIVPKAGTLVEEHVYEAYAMLENIQQRYAATKSAEEIKQIIIKVLRPMRVYQGKGDFFILDLEGNIVLDNTESELEGKPRSLFSDGADRSALAEIIAVAREKNEGSYRYALSHADETGSDTLILTYVKLFKPYGWIIGAAVSTKALEADTKKELLGDIGKVRYGKNGYIFVDDWQGVVLAHGAQPDLVGKNIWNHEDANGVLVVQDLINAAKSEQGDFVFYAWRKPDTGEERPKVSFSRGVKDWQWMVGTGVYIDDVETDIAILQRSLIGGLGKDVLWILLVSGTVGILLLLSLRWVFRRLLRDFSRFDEFFHEAAFSDREIEVANVTFHELRSMALSANKMLSDKVAAQDRLRQHRDHLEEEVAERTQALREKNRQLEQAKDTAEGARQLAEKANRAKSVFLANMSHELRTPLNAVLGFSQLMKNSPEATTEQRKNLDIITQSSEHLLNLINNVLDISKIESGHVELEESRLDLHQMLQELKTLMYMRVEKKGLKFTLEYTPDLPRHITVDGGKLRQVLINLLGNAIKYTRSGSVALKAMLAKQESNERARLRFEVADSGRGIRTEDRERIFAPFVQLDDTPATEKGTGLGLAICKQHIDLMRGEIGIVSEPDRGSVFHFEIPVIVLHADAVSTKPSHGRILGLAGGQPRYRLLIVEDQQENRLLLRQLLDPLGFDLREAVNGLEAVEVFEQWRPHLIFMDIRMPVMDGLQATRRIKADDSGETRIIAITAHALEEERKGILASGFDDFIRKPYTFNEIVDALTRHLGARFVYEENASHFNAATSPDTAALAALPDKLRLALEQALTRIDLDGVNYAIEAIRPHSRSLADALDPLAKGLQFGRILQLIRSCHDESQSKNTAE
ncbi:MAG: cache domain-containing protein [Candidatus Thiodiazotropha sp.]